MLTGGFPQGLCPVQHPKTAIVLKQHKPLFIYGCVELSYLSLEHLSAFMRGWKCTFIHKTTLRKEEQFYSHSTYRSWDTDASQKFWRTFLSISLSSVTLTIETNCRLSLAQFFYSLFHLCYQSHHLCLTFHSTTGQYQVCNILSFPPLSASLVSHNFKIPVPMHKATMRNCKKSFTQLTYKILERRIPSRNEIPEKYSCQFPQRTQWRKHNLRCMYFFYEIVGWMILS